MDQYVKGKNVAQDDFVPEDLVQVLPDNFPWMKLKAGSKLRNIIHPSVAAINETGLVLLSGSGPAVAKVVTVAEIVKRRFKTINQLTRILYKQVDEYWDPKTPDLETLKVTRQIPLMTIVLSLQPIQGSILQSKNYLDEFLNVKSPQTSKTAKKPQKRFQNSAKKVKTQDQNLKEQKDANSRPKTAKNRSAKDKVSKDNSVKDTLTNDISAKDNSSKDISSHDKSKNDNLLEDNSTKDIPSKDNSFKDLSNETRAPVNSDQS